MTTWEKGHTLQRNILGEKEDHHEHFPGIKTTAKTFS